jgi:hypothetical protein
MGNRATLILFFNKISFRFYFLNNSSVAYETTYLSNTIFNPFLCESVNRDPIQ